MRKSCVIAAAILMLTPVFVMAGMTAFDDMTELVDSEMSGLTGQVGITIDVSVWVTDGYIAWGDKSGYSEIYTVIGWLTLSGLTMTNDEGNGPFEVENLTLDAGDDGIDSYIIVGLPDIEGKVAFQDLKIGSAADAGPSLGMLEMGNFDFQPSKMKIRAHD